MVILRTSSLAVFAFLFATALALTPNSRGNPVRHGVPETVSSAARRSVLVTLPAASLFGMGQAVALADTGAEVRGTAVTPFNGLAFQYRGSDFAGLKASDIDEPSVSYNEFMQRLKAGEVKFVEFLAPDGDKAYATFLDKDGKPQQPIRIGEGKHKDCANGVGKSPSDFGISNYSCFCLGYPIEQHDGYSSPAFAIRAVKNANVPYRFSVPALAKVGKK